MAANPYIKCSVTEAAKLQNIFEMSSFGSEFVAMRILLDHAKALGFTLL
jgi:hypothetical protein